MAASIVYGQNNPDIRRICLDRINGTVSIFWSASNASCSTFSAYEIWGREDTTNLFIFLKSEVNRTTTSSVIALPNQKRWQFYIIAKYGCSGFPSYHSDTVFIDDQEPLPVALDSVSIDLFDQKIVVGWQKSLAKDLQGYFLYKVGSSNAIIADTNATIYKFSNLVSSGTGNRISIAAYDSCMQAGLISGYHEPVLLSKYDSNYCQKLFNLRFSPYIGWSVSKYEVYVWEEGSVGYEKLKTLTPTDILSFEVVLKKRNVPFKCFVRAFNLDGTISSSSNILTLRNDSSATHTYARIKRVSELNKTIEIRAEFDNPNGKINNASIFMSTDGFTWNMLTQSSSSPFKGFVANRPVNLYYFKLVVEDNCGNKIQGDPISNNLILNHNQPSGTLTWNSYSYWEHGVQDYSVLEGTLDSRLSTWNINQVYTDNSQAHVIQSSNDKARCYCILATAVKHPINGQVDSSYSNIICPYNTTQVYVPNSFTPNNDGKNETFTAYGSNLDLDRSEITIVNRWGEIITTMSLREGWNGKDRMNNYCPTGIYAYIIRAVLNDGTHYQIQGTTLLIQ
jgi:gliding motility-associated-like protein